MWESFKAEHNKIYADMNEEMSRFNTFVQNLKLIDERNAEETGTATHGITKFADLTVRLFFFSSFFFFLIYNNIIIHNALYSHPGRGIQGFVPELRSFLA